MFNYLGKLDTEQNEELGRVLDQTLPKDVSPKNQRSHELEIVITEVDERVNIEWRFSQQRYDKQTQTTLAKTYASNLRKLIDHCLQNKEGNLSPSDFPLAKSLDQKSLDKLLGKLKAVSSLEAEN